MTETKYARNPLEVAQERTEKRRKEFHDRFPNLPYPGIDGPAPTSKELAPFTAWETVKDITEAVEYATRIMEQPRADLDEIKAAVLAIQTMVRKSEDIIPDLAKYPEIKTEIEDTREKAKKLIYDYHNPRLIGAEWEPPAEASSTASIVKLPDSEVVRLPTLTADRAVLAFDKASHLFPSLVMAPYQTRIGGQWQERGTNVKMMLMRDRPDPWECRLDELDTIIVNIVHGLWLRNHRHPFTATVDEIARMAFGMKPGADVHKSRHDEVQKRLAYMAGFSQAPDPANLSMYASIGDNDPGWVAHILYAIYSPDGTWKFASGPAPSALAYAMGRIGHTRADLLACGIDTPTADRREVYKNTDARASYTSARATLASWLRRRLADYQGISAAEAAQGQPDPTAETAAPATRTIYLAEMLAETWEATALPIPKNGGGNYRGMLHKRIKTVSNIMEGLQSIGAISAWDFAPTLPPPADIVLAAQRWAAANAPETDGRWMAPKGAFTVMGPFEIRIIETRKTPELASSAKRRGRPPRKSTNDVTQ